MNLEESNDFLEEMEKNSQRKKQVLGIIIFCAVLILCLVIMIVCISIKESTTLKMYLDNKEVKIDSDLLIEENKERYINLRKLAGMLGYSYQKGEYKSYNENENSCYIKNDYIIVSMTANQDKYTKYLLEKEVELDENGNVIEEEVPEEVPDGGSQEENNKFEIVVESENETSQGFKIESPIKYINNALYVPFSEMQRVFNVVLDNQEYRIRIYSLEYLAQSYLETAGKLNYTEISNSYENLSAIMDDMLVVGNGKYWGVYSLRNREEVISLKYENITYIQNTKEFLIDVDDKVGIIDKEGKTIIKPTEYDSIAQLDDLLSLYLVKKNKKYGVIKGGTDDPIVFPEYDSIGIKNPEDFANEEKKIRNYSILFEECIPVKYNGKMGIINIDGEENLICVYDSFGCVIPKATDSADNGSLAGANNVLTIPSRLGIKGIVVERDGLYGIYDANVEHLIVPCACTKVYSRTKSGETTYYLEYNGQEIDLDNYLIENNLKDMELVMEAQNNQEDEKKDEDKVENKNVESEDE